MCIIGLGGVVKLLKKMLVMLLVVAGFFWVKAYQPSLQAMYPEHCSFLIDDRFSTKFQQDLKNYVQSKYQVYRDPDIVLDHVASDFVEVASMDAYICKVDKICFTFNAVEPLFLLNDTIVNQNLNTVKKEHYSDDVASTLQQITAHQTSSLQSIMQFMLHLPLVVANEFDVSWHDETEVVLQAKKSKKSQLLFSLAHMPTVADINLFRLLQKDLEDKKNKKRVFDFRFNNQVIVR